MTFETRSHNALWFPPYSPCRITLSGSQLPHCKDTHAALWRGPCEEDLSPAAHSQVSAVQFSSVAQSCPTLCNPMNRSTPGLPVYHQLPELAQTHVHRVGDAIQPSHPLSSPSPPTFNLSQNQGLSQFFASGGQSVGALASASILPMNIQD